jgi:hypothetical protein
MGDRDRARRYFRAQDDRAAREAAEGRDDHAGDLEFARAQWAEAQGAEYWGDALRAIGAMDDALKTIDGGRAAIPVTDEQVEALLKRKRPRPSVYDED